MSPRPELNIRQTVSRFPPGLVGGVLRSLVTDGHRDMLPDAGRFHQKSKTAIFGSENLKTISRGPAFLLFNHPQTSALVEGILTMMYAVSDKTLAGRSDIVLVVAGEIPDGKGGFYNWSPDFMKKLAHVYSTHILLVPNNRNRPDYYSGRREVVTTIGHLLNLSHVVALAAEGNWGKKINETLPDDAVRYGAGQIAIDTYENYRGTVLPIGIGVGEKGNTYLNIGGPLVPDSTDRKVVAMQIAREMKKLLPDKMIVR